MNLEINQFSVKRYMINIKIICNWIHFYNTWFSKDEYLSPQNLCVCITLMREQAVIIYSFPSKEENK